jgi:hypothetical protein
MNKKQELYPINMGKTQSKIKVFNPRFKKGAVRNSFGIAARNFLSGSTYQDNYKLRSFLK